MKLQMAGIDYLHASIGEREAFSLTKSSRSALAVRMVREFGLAGCVILSTCNRTEFWVSGDGSSLESVLAQTIGLVSEDYRRLFTERNGKAAADYLFRLACGMESQIFGEDQILGQVKEAADLAREAGSMDAVLEVLFRSAITGAKAVKTKVKLTPANHSIAEAAVALLQGKYPTLAGQNCLVIGNGEMGRLAARALLSQGANVSITVRKNGCRHPAKPQIPAHCTLVNYEERIALLEQFPIVISATASPHFTLKYEPVSLVLRSPHTFLDLAVPRDIDGRIGQIPLASLFDLDHLGLQRTAEQAALQQANAILSEYQEQFAQWEAFRQMVPRIQSISQAVARDAVLRVQKRIQEEIPAEQGQRLSTDLCQAVDKAVAKCLYGLKETLPAALREPCLHALEQSVLPGDFPERNPL